MPLLIDELNFGMLLPPRDLHTPLLAWYLSARRTMPWRETKDPYAIWLSETMLQQTQVETVKPYYRKFLEKFPTVAALAAADLQEVLHLWAGLGYYRRAKHLHLAAQQIVAKHAAAFPMTLDALLNLPGIGRYTAGAVASIAFNLPTPVVDGNVMRVLSRLTGYAEDIANAKNAPFFWKVAEQILSGLAEDRQQAQKLEAPATENEQTFGNLNQALMELGATICTPPPSRPACLLCPVRQFCRAYAEGTQLQLPVKSKKGKTPVIRGTALVITRKDGREVLMMQRPTGTLWESMWEFPIVASMPQLTARKVSNLLGLPVIRIDDCGEIQHQLTHRRLEIEVARCETVADAADLILPASATAGENRYIAQRWIAFPPHESANLPFAALVHKISEQVFLGKHRSEGIPR